MSTEKEMKEVLKAFDVSANSDRTVVEYSEALGEFKKMLQEGLAKPRGNQLEDAINRNSYSVMHQQV